MLTYHPTPQLPRAETMFEVLFFSLPKHQIEASSSLPHQTGFQRGTDSQTTLSIQSIAVCETFLDSE